MNKKTRVLSLATVMVAMTGMMGISFDQVFAAGNGAGGVGKDGFQLNLIGQDRETDAVCDNNGHRIFVPLQGKFKVMLTEGEFGVIDCNALDKDRKAAFQLPDPNPDGAYDGCLEIEGLTCDLAYSVHIRVLGKPNTSFDILQTCAEQIVDDINGTAIVVELCSTDDVLEVESANGKGKNAKFQNVSQQLLTLCIDYLDDGFDDKGNPVGDGECDERIAIFDDDFFGFTWNFDNDGARNVQLRFIVTEVLA